MCSTLGVIRIIGSYCSLWSLRKIMDNSFANESIDKLV